MIASDDVQIGRLAVALALGLLIGVERGWAKREEAEGRRVAGVRTYGLLGLLGGVSGLAALSLEPGVFWFGLIAVAGVLSTAYASRRSPVPRWPLRWRRAIASPARAFGVALEALERSAHERLETSHCLLAGGVDGGRLAVDLQHHPGPLAGERAAGDGAGAARRAGPPCDAPLGRLLEDGGEPLARSGAEGGAQAKLPLRHPLDAFDTGKKARVRLVACPPAIGSGGRAADVDVLLHRRHRLRAPCRLAPPRRLHSR